MLLIREALDGDPVVGGSAAGSRGPGGVVVGINFAIDPLGAALALLAAVLVGPALVFAWRFFEAVGTDLPRTDPRLPRCADGLRLTGDLFNMFVFFELMSVSAYALTAYRIERAALAPGRAHLRGHQQRRRGD